jgi:hypothetical protein
MHLIGEIFSTFHWLTTAAVVVLVGGTIGLVVILARVFRSDFEQD